MDDGQALEMRNPGASTVGAGREAGHEGRLRRQMQGRLERQILSQSHVAGERWAEEGQLSGSA